jgi:succinate dehydrogenase / fumarate reductase, membrane anchor subunit
MAVDPKLENNRLHNTFDAFAWKWMRYSSILLILLVWGHMILQDIVVGAHAIDLDYVARRWASLGWRIYDFLLLTLAFTHGVNGLRQVAMDMIHGRRAIKLANLLLVIFWLTLTVIGGVAIVGGVGK